jgi:hypothetical protein
MSAPERYLRWNGRSPRGKKLPLLWPVQVWTVLAPQASLRLNVFQEAILGLLHAGERDLNRLAGLLELAPELVAYIIAKELQPMRFVDSQQHVTPEGVKLLKGETGREPRLTLQYAFQDAVFGQWLPRLSTNLPEVMPREGGRAERPEFLLNRDSGWVDRPIMLPRKDWAGPPDKKQVLQAWRQCQRAQAQSSQDDTGFVADFSSEDIDFVGDQPIQARVWCDLYINPDDPQPWLVSDPWHLTGAAKWLREPLQKELPRFAQLAERIGKLLPEVGSSDKETELQVELELAAMPHLIKPEHALLREHLGRVMRQRGRLEKQERIQQEDLNSLAQECASLLEAIVKWLLERWPVDASDWPRTYWSRQHGSELLSQLPLRTDLSRQAIAILCGQEAKVVRLAVIHKDRAFKALLFGALLCTHEHADHPFRHLPASGLQWDRVLELVDKRNKGSHASGQSMERHEMLEWADFTLAWHEQFKPYF